MDDGCQLRLHLRKSGTRSSKKTKEGDKSMLQKTGTVSTIAEYFEKNQQSKSVPISVSGGSNIHNNNGVCMATPNQIMAISGTRADPYMALQSFFNKLKIERAHFGCSAQSLSYE